MVKKDGKAEVLLRRDCVPLCADLIGRNIGSIIFTYPGDLAIMLGPFTAFIDAIPPYCADLTGRILEVAAYPGLTTWAIMLRPFRPCSAAHKNNTPLQALSGRFIDSLPLDYSPLPDSLIK